MTIDVDPDVHARLAAAAAAAANVGGRPVSYCDVICKLLEEAAAAAEGRARRRVRIQDPYRLRVSR